MSDQPPKRIRNLESVEAAEFFVSPTSSRHLEPFVRGECSLAEAAKALGIGKTRMSYWLGKLLQLGLIEEVRIEDRGRYKVPIYCATADVFTVPLEKIPAESDEQILEIHARGFIEAERRAVIQKAREHAEEWYMEYRLWNGQAQRNFVPKTDKSESPFVLSFGTIHLTDSVAQQARQELEDLIRRYGAQANPEGKGYLFKFLMVEEVD